MSTDNFPMPFSVVGYTRPGQGYIAFPESHRNGSGRITRVRLPEGVSTVQLTTSSDRHFVLRHNVGDSVEWLGSLPAATGGEYRTSPPLRVVSANGETDLSMTYSPIQTAEEPEEYVGIIVIPIGAPPAA